MAIHSDSLNNAWLVLQGDVAVVDGSEPIYKILTSAPETCTVFSLYDKESQIGSLAHLDTYTSVNSALEKIREIFIRKNKKRFDDCKFTATVCGGIKECKVSIRIKNYVCSELVEMGISISTLELCEDVNERPQLLFDASKGTLVPTSNKRLEYLQRRELWIFERYYGFNNENIEKFLKSLFQFKAREATRTERHLGCFTDEMIPEEIPSSGSDEIRPKINKEQLEKLEKQRELIWNAMKDLLNPERFLIDSTALQKPSGSITAFYFREISDEDLTDYLAEEFASYPDEDD